MTPRIHIFGGPNGAGKSTFAREYLLQEAGCPVFINADLIAAGLSPFQPERMAVKAGKIMLEMVKERTERRESFAFESTLSGLSWAREIPAWRRLGFQVELVFLSLPSAEFAMERVAYRVRQGGHSIPEEVVRRRFESGFRNFRDIYRALVDHWVWFDNSGSVPIQIDEGANG